MHTKLNKLGERNKKTLEATNTIKIVSWITLVCKKNDALTLEQLRTMKVRLLKVVYSLVYD